MQLEIKKMQGSGNQILIVDQRDNESVSPCAEILQKVRNSELGNNFDQLMWLSQPQNQDSVASYRVFNYDGSEVEQCGNGVRCVAIYLHSSEPQQTEFLLESPAGIVAARILGENRASVSMGAPQFAAKPSEICVDNTQIEVNIVSMGNPHCVLDVVDVDTADVAGLGPAIEHHEQFPKRINVGFMHIVDRGNIDLRVFERGAGETLACGTGACAAVASGHRRGLLDDEVAVRLPGGQLVVSWRGGADTVWLTGDADFMSEGKIDL
jgi:diaminopimelate epimerase